jgi:predicted dehydrogenase
MARIGIAGIGFMGMIHYLAYQQAGGANVVALCTRDEKKLRGDWRDIKGNFGPPGQMMDLSGIAKYARLEELLADPGVDVVDICLPPAMHAEATLAALKAGKHVFCEKPIAVSADDADRMVRAAKAADRQLLIGHVLPFFPEYDFALRTVQSGQYGRLLGGHFKRIISDPKWLADFYDPQKVGGPVVDLHIHDAHFIRVLCGMPQAVFSTGRTRGTAARMAGAERRPQPRASKVSAAPPQAPGKGDAVVDFVNTQFLFADPQLSVTASSGVLYQQGRAFTHAFEIYLEQAALLFDFAVIDGQGVVPMPLTVLTTDDRVLRPELGSGDPIDGFVREINEVTRAIESGKPSALLDGNLARDALLLCHRQSESVHARQVLRV